jgi:predicted ArsR family transcriptional regulator
MFIPKHLETIGLEGKTLGSEKNLKDMSRKNQPQTSKDAYASLQLSEVQATYQKIIGALERLGTASTEQIADFLTIDHSKIHKRTKEMQDLKMIFRPGHRVPTKSGRTAFVWCLCVTGAKTDRENKPLPGKSIVDYSKTISDIQANLF